MPRSEDRIDGSPGAKLAQSEITTASALRRLFCSSTNDARLSLPTSSSPSASTTTFTGSLPRVARCASSAFTCRKRWPLSSPAPRANGRSRRRIDLRWHADLVERILHPFGGALCVAVVLRFRADTRDAQKLEQLVVEARIV